MSRVTQKQKKTSYEKLLLAKAREYNNYFSTPIIYEEIKPYHDGYLKVISLKKDILCINDNIDEFNELLKIVYNQVWSSNKSFLIKFNWRSKRKVINIPELKVFQNRKEFEAKVPTYLRKHFSLIWKYNQGWYFSAGHYSLVYGILNESLFTTKIVKHYVTEVRVIDKELESRHALINNFLIQNNAWCKVNNMHGRKFWSDFCSPKKSIKLSMALDTLIEDVYNCADETGIDISNLHYKV